MNVQIKNHKQFEGVFKGLTEDQYKEYGIPVGDLDYLVGVNVIGESFDEIIIDDEGSCILKWVKTNQSRFTIPMGGF